MTGRGQTWRRARLSVVAMMLAALLVSAVTAKLGARQTAATTRADSSPKLVVLLVVDQMRADYIERFKNDWTGGLKRLVAEGAWFRKAAYPYLTTVTCPGHATIATGAFPSTHGVIQNVWWDRDQQSLVDCTADDDAKIIGYGVPLSSSADSARRVMIPTFADELRAQRRGRVVSLSLKPHAAAPLAGHGGDAVTWYENRVGWATSSAYTSTPVAAVDAFVRANPVSADQGKAWTRLLSPVRYHEVDEGLGEAPPRGWGSTFPHVLRGADGKPDEQFTLQWRSSPFGDAYVARFAAALTESMKLGRSDGPDLLAVSFSSPDYVGHAFGPRSQEIQDIYAQLDRAIGTLLDDLDRIVGKDQYVLALSADHGVTPIPEQLVAEGEDAGRLSSPAISNAIEQVLRREFGEGKYLARTIANDIYFAPGVYDRLRMVPGTVSVLTRRLEGLAGVARVYRAEQVRDGKTSSDPLLRAAALSYFPKRSGDLILVPKPFWMFASGGTTHGTPSSDDQRVPIVLFGRGIKRGEYADSVTPADIAPTLAALCGISLPHADGHVLSRALK